MIEYPQALIFTWALGKKQKKLSHAPKMKTRKVLLSLLLLLLPLCSGGKKGKRLEETDSFDVKPSGQIAHQTIKLENGVTCIFTYAAVGGTNEEWSINLRKSKKDEYKCSVARPEQSSYLYFMSFALSILEHDVLTAEVFDNSGALLQNEEYIITEDLKSVQHKENGFKANLARATVTARTHKNSREL